MTTLTPSERAILNCLQANAGQVVSKGTLISTVNQKTSEPAKSNSIEVLVARVRRKITGHTIKAKRGEGYILVEVAPSE